MYLKSVFEQDYKQDLSTATYSEWELEHAEISVYFKNYVILNHQQDQEQFTIIARSKASVEDGMVLQLQIRNELCILPVWYNLLILLVY